MTQLSTIRLNEKARIRTQEIADGESCVIVDDFLEDPDAVIEFACANQNAFTQPEYPYPGVRLDLDERMVEDLHQFIRLRMSRQFSFLRGDIVQRSGLSIITMAPDELSVYQRLCHIDPSQTGRRQYAALVYLYDDERLGGTAFYRIKQPVIYEHALHVCWHDDAAASRFLAEHCELFRGPPRYMTDSNELAELLTVVPARFNRLVFYRGDMHHSGYITAPELLTDDLRTGRLTLNCFISVVPK